MNPSEELVIAWTEAFVSAAVGWDFSSLAGSMNEPEPPWDHVYDAETDARMPFDDECFSLVVNRHEAYSPVELRRVLSAGGTFLTQQVGSLDARETVDWFGERPRQEWTLDRAATQLEEAGWNVMASDDYVAAYRFDSMTTLLRYFALVPWDLPDDFSVEGYLPALTLLHDTAESGHSIELTLHRWYLEARRPD